MPDASTGSDGDPVVPDLATVDLAAAIAAPEDVRVPRDVADVDRFRAAIAAIDEANRDDPNSIDVHGAIVPKELAHAVLACAWVPVLDPDAGEVQLLAARAHHVRRWVTPRADYPDGRAGYLRWRAALKKQHGAEVQRILTGAGYDDETTRRVQQIVRKEGLARDPAVQTHEDALCLVFIQTQLLDLTEQLGDDHIVEVVAKTMAKMSAAAIAIAGGLEVDDRSAAVIGRAAARVVATPSD